MGRARVTQGVRLLCDNRDQAKVLDINFDFEILVCYYPDLLNGHGEEDDAAGGRLTCAAGDALGDVDAGHALDEQRHLLDDCHHLKKGKCWNYVLHVLSIYPLLDHPDS